MTPTWKLLVEAAVPPGIVRDEMVRQMEDHIEKHGMAEYRRGYANAVNEEAEEDAKWHI